MSRETSSPEQHSEPPEAEDRADIDAALDTLNDVISRLERDPDNSELVAERDRVLQQVGKAAGPLIEEARIARINDKILGEAQRRGDALHDEFHAETAVQAAEPGPDADPEPALEHIKQSWLAAEKHEATEKENLIATNELIESSMNWVLIQIDELLKDSPRERDVTRRLAKVMGDLRQQESACLEIPERPSLAFFHKSEAAQKQSIRTLRQLNRLLSSAAGKVAEVYNDLHTRHE